MTCYMILRDHSLAEEVTQDAFMAAYEKINTLKDPAKFCPWVTTIAAHKATSLYMRNKKVFPMDEVGEMDFFSQKAQKQNDLSDAMIMNELSSEVKEAISKLKPELREIVVLKYYLALKDAEISEYLGKPIGTVKSSLFRAKKILAKSLSPNQLKLKRREKECEDIDEAQ